MIDFVLWFCPISAKIGNIRQCGGIRYFLCKRIFRKYGKYVNIEKKSNPISGIDVEIGDY